MDVTLVEALGCVEDMACVPRLRQMCPSRAQVATFRSFESPGGLHRLSLVQTALVEDGWLTLLWHMEGLVMVQNASEL